VEALDNLIICLVKKEDVEWWFTFLRCGRGWVFATEGKGACRYIRFQRSSRYL